MTDDRTMEVQLNLNPSQDPNAGRVCAEWLRRSIEMIGGELYPRLLEAEPLDQSVMKKFSYGPPGAIWSQYVITNERGQREVFAFSLERWNAMLNAMTEPLRVEFELTELNEQGYPDSPVSITVDVKPSEDNPDWWFLTALFSEDWLRSSDYEGKVTELLAGCASLGDPSYGQVTFYYNDGESPLEEAMRMNASEQIATSREYLRGYSWLTVLNRDFVARLGLDSLRLSGAFYSIRDLTGGSALLQATEHYFEYGYEAAERIFRPLAPVLHPGEPIFMEGSEPPCYLAYADAAKYQK